MLLRYSVAAADSATTFFALRFRAGDFAVLFFAADFFGAALRLDARASARFARPNTFLCAADRFGLSRMCCGIVPAAAALFFGAMCGVSGEPRYAAAVRVI